MNNNLSRQQFKEYTLEYKGADEQGGHSIVAKKEGKPIGEMRWEKGLGVSNVDVDPLHQRKGVATAMWNMGIELKKQDKSIPTIKHSQDRTEAGDDWAKKVGRYYHPEAIWPKEAFNE
jgi:GNAT superfamily N-acetyltransferase